MNCENTAQSRSLAGVRDECCRLAASVMQDPRRCIQVHEAANAYGKAISACKIHLEYCALAGVKPDEEWARFIGK